VELVGIERGGGEAMQSPERARGGRRRRRARGYDRSGWPSHLVGFDQVGWRRQVGLARQVGQGWQREREGEF
jgi:hypothetical protein